MGRVEGRCLHDRLHQPAAGDCRIQLREPNPVRPGQIPAGLHDRSRPLNEFSDIAGFFRGVAGLFQVGPRLGECRAQSSVQFSGRQFAGLREDLAKAPPGSIRLPLEAGGIDAVLPDQVGNRAYIVFPIPDIETLRDRRHLAGAAIDGVFRGDGEHALLAFLGDDVGYRRAAGVQGELRDDPAERRVDRADSRSEQARGLARLAFFQQLGPGALQQFGRRLVGEGGRQDGAGFGAGFDRTVDFAHQPERLARPGAGDHQVDGPAHGHDGVLTPQRCP